MEQLGITKDSNKLIYLIGDNLYKTKTAFIREITQNAIDATEKLKSENSKKPVITLNDDTGKLTIRDYGCSFDSKEHFKSMMCSIGDTDKDGDDTQIGGKGIGSISVMKHAKKWLYKVYKNGRGFDCTMIYTENKGISYDMSDYYDTSERDGVLFKVEALNLQISTFKELFAFSNKVVVKRKLCGLYTNVNPVLLETDDFVLTSYTISNKIVVDCYTYNYSDYIIGDLNYNHYSIGLKFKQDEEIKVSMNREEVEITPKVESLIREKYEKAIDYISSYKSSLDKQYVPNNFNEFVRMVSTMSDNVVINNTNYEVGNDNTIKYGDFSGTNDNKIIWKVTNKRMYADTFRDRSYIDGIYKLVHFYDYGVSRRKLGKLDRTVPIFFLDEKTFTKNKREYLQSVYSKFVVVKDSDEKLAKVAGYGNKIQGFPIDIFKEHFNNLAIPTSSVILSKEAQKVIEKKIVKKRDGNLSVRLLQESDRGWRSLIYRSDKLDMRSTLKAHYIYTVGENLKGVYNIFYELNKNNIKIISVSNRAKEKIEENGGEHFSELYEKRAFVKYLSKPVTYLYLKENHTKIKRDHLQNLYKLIDPSYKTDISSILQKIENMYSLSEIETKLVTFAKDHNLLDKDILDRYNMVESMLNNLTVLLYCKLPSYESDEKIKKKVIESLKKEKFKYINKEFYNIKKDEDEQESK